MWHFAQFIEKPRKACEVVSLELARVFVQDEEIARAIFQRAALRGENAARELVPRRVRGDVVADPFVIGPHRRRAQFLARDEQQVAPFVAPVIDELRAREQRFDEPVALVRCGVGEEGARFFRGRQNAAGVEERAANELAIGAARRRREIERGELFENEIVDPIAPLRFREDFGRDGVWKWRGHGADRDVAEIPGRHGALAIADDRDLSIIVHVDDRLIGRGVLHMPRHVLDVAVGEMRAHDELLFGARREFGQRGLDFEALNARVVRLRHRSALRDPIDQRPPFRRIDLEPLAALVRHGVRRLEQDQRARRIGWRNPPPKGAARQRQVIAIVIVTRAAKA